MEVIFTITEDSETNIAVASENTPSSELNLPNPQAAVASQFINASEHSFPSVSVSSLEHGNTTAGQ